MARLAQEEGESDEVYTERIRTQGEADLQTESEDYPEETPAVDPVLRKPRHRSSLLQEPTHARWYQKLMTLKIGGLAQFQTWNTQEQKDAIREMLDMLGDSQKAQEHWDRQTKAHRELVDHANQAIKDKDNYEVTIQEQHSELETLRSTLADRDAVVSYLQAQNQRPREATPDSPNGPSNHQSRPKELEDPDQFTGQKDKDGRPTISFDRWRLLVEDKLETDSHLFDTEQRKIRYVCNLTGGKAHNHIWPKMADREFETVQDVIDTLTAVFHDPHQKSKAKAELAKLYQGNWSFHHFHNEFARIVRPLKLSEDDLIEELTAKLNKEFTVTAVNNTELTYDQLVRKLHIVDKAIQASEARSKARTPQGLPGNSQANRGATAATEGLRRFPNQRTPEEKAVIIEKRLCIKCCKPGHIILNCPETRSLPFPEHLKPKTDSNKTILPRKPQVNNVEAEEEDQSENA
jgi:hypothetical protein